MPQFVGSSQQVEMGKDGGLWLSARAAATMLVLGAPPIMNLECNHRHFYNKVVLNIYTSTSCKFTLYIAKLQPRIHLCDYIAQIADADTTCNGIKWQRVWN